MGDSTKRLPNAVEVFYSYSHKDEAFREQLEAHLAILQRQGILHGWHDRMIGAGEAWRAHIDAHLESADVILLLISPDFLASDYCYDIEMKRALERERAGEAKVIPIILRDCIWKDAEFSHLQALPTDGKPVSRWTHPDEAFTDIASGIRTAALKLRRTAAMTTVSPFLETGAMPGDSRFYVERSADRLVEQLSGEPGQTLIVKGYRQSGKTSMLNRLHAASSETSCFLDFQALGSDRFKTSDQLFPALAQMITDELATDVKPRDVWLDERDPQQNLTLFVEEVLKSYQDKPLRIIFDETDRAFAFEATRHDLFSMIRSWHNRRARTTRPQWRQLDLVVAHSTDPALWITDPTQSPFNVGTEIRLEDFGLDEIDDLNLRYGEPLRSTPEAQRLMDLVAGHPYLVRLALHTMATQALSLGQLERSATEDHGPFASHLSHYLRLLLKNVELQEALRQVMKDGALDQELHYQRLWSAGLIRGARREEVALRCRVYEDFFMGRL
jgi:hypothetical protein